jgi:hypothetical protein
VLPRLGDGFGARASLGDYLELPMPVKEGNEPLADDLVIIDDEKSKGSVWI